ncbi:MAG: hypothetical protein U0V70_08895 [Terriglobia bacterium]
MKFFSLRKSFLFFSLFILLSGLDFNSFSEGSDVEARVVKQLRNVVQSGEPVIVSKLYNEVFTSPAERKVIDRLYNIFFRFPSLSLNTIEIATALRHWTSFPSSFGLKVPGRLTF